MLRSALGVLAAVLVSGCTGTTGPLDSGTDSGALDSGNEADAGSDAGVDAGFDAGIDAGLADETWTSSTHLTAATTVASGRVVEIAPGASIAVDPGVTVTVAGTLRASAVAARATLTGTGWTGLVVAAGGHLTLDGVDLAGATTPLDVRTGGIATVGHGTLTGATRPFAMQAGATLSISHVTVVAASAQSDLAGAFTASYLEYQKAGGSEGLVVSDPLAEILISDSTFSGTTTGAGDFIVSGGARHLRLEYSVVRGAHCGFHLTAVDKLELDHVTSGGLAVSATPGDTNAWGGMFYGAGAGPHTISNCNFVDTSADIDLQGANGTLTITNTHTGGRDTLAPSASTVFTWASGQHAALPIADAHPR